MKEKNTFVDNATGGSSEEQLTGLPVAVAVAVADPKLRRLLLDGLDIAGLPIVDGNCEVSPPEALVATVERLRPDILFVGLNGLGNDPDSLIARIAALRPAPRVVAVSDGAAPDAIKMAMRAGAAEFVYPPFVSPAFEESLQRVVADCARAANAGRVAGAILGFVSVKGGCGATTLACHSAAHLRATAQKQVLLADLDMAAGIAGTIMQANGRYNLQDAFQNLQRMDLKLWKGIVAAAPSGVDVIPASPDPPSAVTPPGRRVSTIFRFWQTQYEFTVVDFGHGVTQALLDALGSMDSLVLVATNEMLALRQAQRMIQVLATHGFGTRQIRLVINRMPKRTQISVAELEKVMGLPIYATIPNDYQRLNEAYSEPRLLQAGSDLTVQIGKFADRLAGIDGDGGKRRRFFGLRRKK